MSNPGALGQKNNIAIRPQIEAALVRASKATGVDFKYLVDTAVRIRSLSRHHSAGFYYSKGRKAGRKPG